VEVYGALFDFSLVVEITVELSTFLISDGVELGLRAKAREPDRLPDEGGGWSTAVLELCVMDQTASATENIKRQRI